MSQMSQQSDYLTNQLESALWPQLNGFLAGIKQSFGRLSQELAITRRERDRYKDLLNTQAKEFDDFRQSIGISLGGSSTNNQIVYAHTDAEPEEASITFPIATLSPESYSSMEEEEEDVTYGPGTSDNDKSQEIDYEADVAAQLQEIVPIKPLSPTTSTLSSTDANSNTTLEVTKKKRSDCYAEYNTDVKKVLDVNPVYTFLREATVSSVRFSGDGKYLAAACANGVAKLYDTTTGMEVCALATGYPCERKAIGAICFSPDNRYLATAGGNKIRIWQVDKKHVCNILKGHKRDIYSLDFSPDGQVLVSGSWDTTVQVWNIRTGISKIIKGAMHSVWCVRFSRCGRYIVAGGASIHLWNVRTRSLTWSSGSQMAPVHSVNFTRDGNRLVSGSTDEIMKLWDVTSLRLPEWQGSQGVSSGLNKNKEIQCLLDFADPGEVWSTAVSHDGQWVISGSATGSVSIYNACNGERQCVLRGHNNKKIIFSVDFSPGGSYFATGCSDRRVILWSYRTI